MPPVVRTIEEDSSPTQFQATKAGYHPGHGAGTRGSGSYIYGTEYETAGKGLNSLHDDNVPGAACHAYYVTRCYNMYLHT